MYFLCFPCMLLQKLLPFYVRIILRNCPVLSYCVAGQCPAALSAKSMLACSLKALHVCQLMRKMCPLVFISTPAVLEYCLNIVQNNRREATFNYRNNVSLHYYFCVGVVKCMSAYTCGYVQILASQHLWVFLNFFAIAVKFHSRIIDIFSYYEEKWIFCKTKLICVTEISLESDKMLVLQPFLFGSFIPQGSLVLDRTALNSTAFCGKHLKHS